MASLTALAKPIKLNIWHNYFQLSLLSHVYIFLVQYVWLNKIVHDVFVQSISCTYFFLKVILHGSMKFNLNILLLKSENVNFLGGKVDSLTEPK